MMGNEKKEDAVEQLEDILGFGSSGENKDEPKGKEPKADENKDEPKGEEPKADEKKEEPATKTTVVTDEQISISQDIAKIDVKIEELEKVTVDTSEFYSNLETHLSEEEQALEFDDKPAYMKLINTKVKEFEDKNSKADEIQTLKDEKKDKELVYERQSAIVEVSAKYPDYDHEKILEYFTNDLSKAEQKKIFDSSSSYTDVYEKAYKKHLESNPANIQSESAPNIPDVSKSRKEPASAGDTDDGLMDEDTQLQEALGL